MTMHVPTVSVLMTAFNRERYIGAAIESVLAQTFDDFELVIVDDRSTDRTVDVARAYAARDPRIRVAINERNLGDYANRNHAASLARGTFLKYHDSDDIMYPHCLAVMLDGLATHPSAGFALTASRHWPGAPCPMLLLPRQSYQREFLGAGQFMVGPACALFRTEIFRALGGFRDVGLFSDHVFWLRACARVPVVLVSGDLFWYRIHADQQLYTGRPERDTLCVSPAVWAALNAPECPLDAGEREIAKANHAYVTAREAWRDARRGRWRFAIRRLRTAGLSGFEWLRYLRPPRRTVAAGTPVDPEAAFAPSARPAGSAALKVALEKAALETAAVEKASL